MRGMMMKTLFVKTIRLSLFAGLMLIMAPAMASASEGGVALKHADISLDQKTIKAGLAVFTDFCMGCHTAK